ncbi:hypothetical protein RchiOBHm_Chr5g0047801 [Rosa chinensis]|uniref:Uncharacterized protein n=1 Tax=Rosa chinensis TaxID=74649 RepID=A0A2P6QEH1_ROSCH|nr:hypothetical protein RchiOBHm_Chr5g0047801 [Rosa chinensis]
MNCLFCPRSFLKMTLNAAALSLPFIADTSLSIVLLSCSFLCSQIPNPNPHRHKLGEKPSTCPPFVSEKHHQKYERSYF